DRYARRASAGSQHVSRVVARRGWRVSLSRRAWPPAVAGVDSEGIQAAVTGVAVPGARVVDAAGVEPRSVVRRAEHACGAARQRTAAVGLRPARIVERRLLACADRRAQAFGLRDRAAAEASAL